MSQAFAQRLREARANTWEQTKELLDGAAGEKRDLTAEENETYERMTSDLDSLDERIKDLDAAEERSRQAEAILSKLADGERDAESTEGAELRTFLRGEVGEFESRSERSLNLRALTSKTSASGGATVPTSFHEQLMVHLVEMSGVLAAGPTVWNTASGEPLDLPITTAHGTATQVAENVAITGTEPTFGKRALTSWKYGQLVTAPKELIDDSGVDIEGYLAQQAGWALGNGFGADLVTGAGTTEPFGVATQATAGKTGAAAVGGAFTSDDLIDLYHSVIGPYRARPSAGWLMRDATLAAIRKLKDQQDQYLWQPSLQMGAPDLLLGKPVHTDPNVAAVGVGAKSVLFGAFDAYVVRLVGGVRFERSSEFAFDKDQIVFRALLRGDAITLDQTGAIKAFVGGAAS